MSVAPAIAVAAFVAGKSEVRVREVAEHLRGRGYRGPDTAAARMLRELGFERRVRACGTVYVAPAGPGRNVRPIDPLELAALTGDAAAVRRERPPRHLSVEDFDHPARRWLRRVSRRLGGLLSGARA